jgi:8-oxo-dGTP pyrophosphatase MutT (NUDIX family)
MNDLAQDYTRRLTESERDQSFPNLRPKDAATLILIDRAAPVPKVLLGRRHAGHKFMPGKFVFPGGRVEPIDRRMPAATPLHPQVEARLLCRVQRPSPAKARAYALAAIRETFEEAGLLLGVKQPQQPAVPSPLWDGFAAASVHPDLGVIHFIARAITPPNRTRRFDTRFFAVDAGAIAHRIDGIIGPDSELIELVWLPLDEARQLDMPTITGVVLQELQARIAAGFGHDLPVPFYRMRHRKFQRELL